MLQGDDYILYCHPSRQKTPRSEHLREWYLRMLRQAQVEGSVTHLSNLWDTFFDGGRDHRVDRPSSTHLPYFEGANISSVTLQSLECSPLGLAEALWNLMVPIAVLVRCPSG